MIRKSFEWLMFWLKWRFWDFRLWLWPIHTKWEVYSEVVVPMPTVDLTNASRVEVKIKENWGEWGQEKTDVQP